MTADLLSVRVSRIRPVAPMIREFTLTPVSGELPHFSPGSHIVVNMQGQNPDATPRQWKNAYSLLSDPADASTYRIAVRLQDHSRGGSVFMHQSVREGDVLAITPPANLFAPLWRARKHLLIAGGVGITPFMSYLPEMQRRGLEVELHYSFHSRFTGAYQEQLQTLLGDNCYLHDSDQGQRCNLSEALQGQPLGTHVYICGPQSLIDAVQQTAASLGYPASAIHYEEFAAPKPGLPFAVTLQGSGKTIEVGAEQSLLEALEAAHVEIPNMCRGGVCGRCVTTVLKGEAEHRDSFLADEDKASCIMPCVSRAKSPTLVLDL
jgi:dimethylamine monooxygenase subunit B